MKQRLGYVLCLALATGSLAVSACSGDDDESAEGKAGASGSGAGTKTGGSSSGGSSNKAGSGGGGKAGNGMGGMTDEGGAAGEADGGATPGGAPAGGAGGVGGDGGAANSMGGEAGAGGSAPTLTYACGSNTLPKKLCSAFVGANCTDPTVCADCVMERTTELADFLASFPQDNQCATCLEKYDAYFQCGIDAFESGNISSGIECIDDYGADLSFDNCVPLQSEANACHTWLNEHECPATWPPT